MSSKPDSTGMFLIELINAKWSSKYDNDRAIKAAKHAMKDEPELTEEWLQKQMDLFDQDGYFLGSWRDYRNGVVHKRWAERTSDEFIDNFDKYYRTQPWK